MRLLFINLLFLFSLSASADRILYGYDSSGNRTSAIKEIVYSRSQDVDSVHSRQSYRDSLSLARITIYPNPTRGDLRIEITGVNDFEHSSITIYGLNGAVLYLKDQAEALNELDITSWTEGIYLMVIRINGESTTWKIIKE